jgi:O-antigen/teichoic acid export membrane protein
MSRRISVNFMFNVGGAVLPMAAALVTVPIYISHIGAARYGILAVVWIMLGYFGFLDFGLSRASANALSRLGDAGPEERGPVLMTAFYLNLALGSLGGVVLWLCSGFLLHHFANLPPDLAREAIAASPWIACMLPVALVSAIGNGAIESREHFLTSNAMQTLGGVIAQVLPVCCAILFGPSLTVVIPAALVARLLPTLIIWAIVARREWPLSPRQFDRSQVRELLGYGAWVSVSSGISPLLETFDQMMIAALLGPTSSAHYAVPMSLATRSQVVALALSKTLFPRLSRLNSAEALALASRAVVTLAIGFGAICGPAILLAAPFLEHWVGPSFAAGSIAVARLLLIGAWLNGLAFIPFSLLLGQRRPHTTARIHLFELLPFLGATYLLVRFFGIEGAAIAWSLRGLADCTIMLVASGCWNRYLLRVVPSAALLALAWFAAPLVPDEIGWSLLWAALLGIASVVVGLIVDPGARQTAQHFVNARLPSALGRFRPQQSG